jgi:hypothetical protein
MVAIDTSDIPQERRDDPRLFNLKNRMQIGLSNPVIQDAMCLHEAAHLLYATQANAPIRGYKGPYITYDSKRNEFDAYTFSVIIDTVTKEALKMDRKELILTRSKIFAAGGVASRELTDILNFMPDAGEGADRVNFEAFCAAAGLHIPAERETTWLWAQDQVRQHLRVQKVRDVLWALAAEIKPLLIGNIFTQS